MDGLRTFDNWLSRLVCEEVLSGSAYPAVDFVHDIDLVMDVGANVGAAAVYFTRLYPDASLHSFEPGAETYALLEENTSDLPNVHIHSFGLHDHDGSADLFRGETDSATSSLSPGDNTGTASERVELRDAAAWVAEHNVGPIDLLKIDTEGCEIPILTSLADQLPHVKILYVEAHSDQDRREIERMVAPSHSLLAASALYPTAELTYVRRDRLRDKDALNRWKAKMLQRAKVCPAAMPG